jgi:hypothetical protein
MLKTTYSYRNGRHLNHIVHKIQQERISLLEQSLLFPMLNRMWKMLSLHAEDAGRTDNDF